MCWFVVFCGVFGLGGGFVVVLIGVVEDVDGDCVEWMDVVMVGLLCLVFECCWVGCFVGWLVCWFCEGG